MNDIDIAIIDGSTDRSSLLELVKGCTEDSSGVAHAMVPIVFTGDGNTVPDLTVVNRAILKRDVTTNKQGVASMVIQVKIPYVRVASPSPSGSTSGAATKQGVVTKDYISCHMVVALPKSMLTDWRDSARQADAELQLNTALLILGTWVSQHGLMLDRYGEKADLSDGNIRQTFRTPVIRNDKPSSIAQWDDRIAVEGQPDGRAQAFKMPSTPVLRDPLTDPLMSLFNGVCAEVKPSTAAYTPNL